MGTSNANLHINFLQSGSVLVFDIRQTAGPMKSLVGLTSNPVHTVHSLAQTSSLPSGVKTVLSASAIGLCQWNIDSEERYILWIFAYSMFITYIVKMFLDCFLC